MPKKIIIMFWLKGILAQAKVVACPPVVIGVKLVLSQFLFRWCRACLEPACSFNGTEWSGWRDVVVGRSRVCVLQKRGARTEGTSEEPGDDDRSSASPREQSTLWSITRM